jgi:micrococcal nuclease
VSFPRVRFSALRFSVVATACFLSCGPACHGESEGGGVGAGRQFLPTEAKVLRVIDGDTVELMDGRLLRYIGIDAPEVRRRARPGDREWRPGEAQRWVVDPEPMSREAMEFNRRLVDGKLARLEYDVQTHDRFGRLLAYVYVWAKGGSASRGNEVMVNAELLREGFAQILTIPPNVKYAERFRVLTQEAREGRRGLWGSAPSASDLPVSKRYNLSQNPG